MKIVLTGGGSGGHITPLLAVAAEIKSQRHDVWLVYVGQRGDPLAASVRTNNSIDEVRLIWAGKLRRYHGEGWKQLFNISETAKNIRDLFLIGLGLWQSYWLLRRLKPQALFVKGGYVSVPVGLAAAMRDVPYITHDSDALPGLSNRILARWATMHAVGLPKDLYPYLAAKTEYVGVPISSQYQPVTEEAQIQFRQALGLEGFSQVIFMSGGGNGAQPLNEALVGIAPELLKKYPHLAIVHQTGQKNETIVREAYEKVLSAEDQQRIIIKSFVTDLYRYSGAADLVITRAGATSMAEFAAQHKACIVIPNPLLTGGHQLKNAEAWSKASAVKIVDDQQLKQAREVLLPLIGELLDSQEQRRRMGEALSKFAMPDAARKLAELTILIAERAKKGV